MRPKHLAGGLLVLLVQGAHPLAAQKPSDLAGISLDSLLHVRISAAARYDQTTAEAPSSVTILTAGDIRRVGYRSLDQVLAAVRGFYTSSDRNYEYIGVRGFGRPTDYNNRVLLTLNGMPLNDAFYGQAAAGTELGINLEALERIEIVRGPGSTLYGANAMFAVVNLVTRSGRSIEGAELHQELGPQRTRRTWGLAGSSLGSRGSFHLSGEIATTDGEDLHFAEYDASPTHGLVRGLDGDQHRNIFAQVQLGGLTVDARATVRDKHVPTGAWDANFGDPGTWTRDQWQTVGATWSSRLDDSHRLSLHGSYDRYTYRGYYPVGSTLQQDGNNVTRFLADGELTWDLRADNRLVLGGEVRRVPRAAYWEYDETEVFVDGDWPYTTWSLFAQDEQHVTNMLSLLLGVRYDHSSMTGGRPSRRAALLLTPDRNTVVKLLYGDAFRAASVYEQNFQDPNFTVAGPLRPEVVRTSELIVERHLGHQAWATFSAFDSRVSHLIDTIERADGTSQFVNRQRAVTDGLEAELVARSSAGHMARVSYTRTLARDPDTDSDLSNSPDHLGRFTAVAVLPRHASLATEFRCESGRLTLRGTHTGAFCVGDVNLVSERLVRGLTASLRVTNVFDRPYYAPGGYEHRQAAIVQRGRQLIVSLGYRFEGRAEN